MSCTRSIASLLLRKLRTLWAGVTRTSRWAAANTAILPCSTSTGENRYLGRDWYADDNDQRLARSPHRLQSYEITRAPQEMEARPADELRNHRRLELGFAIGWPTFTRRWCLRRSSTWMNSWQLDIGLPRATMIRCPDCRGRPPGSRGTAIPATAFTFVRLSLDYIGKTQAQTCLEMHARGI
jgi:hypothetical protein